MQRECCGMSQEEGRKDRNGGSLISVCSIRMFGGVCEAKIGLRWFKH